MKLIKRLKNVHFKTFHIICIITLIIPFVLILINSNALIDRIIISMKCFADNVRYYFLTIFDKETSDSIQSYDFLFENLYEVGKTLEIVPKNYELFVEQITSYFAMPINGDIWLDYIEKLLIDIIFWLRIIMIALLAVPFYKLLKYKFLHENKKTNFDETKPYKIAIIINDKIMYPFKKIINKFTNFIKENRYYLIILVVEVIVLCRGVNIVLDFIGFYFYFVASFKIVTIYKEVIMLICDLFPILKHISTFGFIVINYFLLCLIRRKIGYKKLMYLEKYNKGFISSLGVTTLIDGTPGSDKTLTATDMTISKEEMLRSQALDILFEIYLRFPNFDYYALETELITAVEFGNIKNQVQIKYWMRNKKKRFLKNPSIEKIFGYDYKHLKMYHYDELKNEYIFDALSDYARAYFVYALSGALSMSNYAIRHDIDEYDGKFPLYGYDYFKRDYRDINDSSMYAKIIDYDAFRLGKKIIKDNPNANIIDGCVVVEDENDKERRNQLTTRHLDYNSETANQLNDGYNDFLKMVRHFCTIRHRCFFARFSTMQRSNDVDSGSREVNEYVLNLKSSEKEWKSAMPLWWIEPILCEFIIARYRNFYLKYRNNRCDKTLIMLTLGTIASCCNRYLEKYENTFDYYTREIEKKYSSDTSKVVREDKYFIMKKKAYCDRYSTDCYSNARENKYLKAKVGFKDRETYTSNKATIDELKMQHSYFIDLLIGKEE